jgi:flagellar assembly protein FliH
MRIEEFQFNDLRNAADPGKAASKPTFSPGLVPEVAKKAAAPAEPTFSRAELDAAEKRGYDAGHSKGITDGHAQSVTEQTIIDKRLMAATDHLVLQVSKAFGECRAAIEKQQQDVPRLALEIARKIAGEAAKAQPYAAIEQMAAQCIAMLAGTPRVVITVHETLAPSLDRRLKDTITRNDFAGEIVVAGNADMPVEDCQIEWQNGQAERDTASMWAEIARIIGVPASAQPAHDGAKSGEGPHEPKLYIAH